MGLTPIFPTIEGAPAEATPAFERITKLRAVPRLTVIGPAASAKEPKPERMARTKEIMKHGRTLLSFINNFLRLPLLYVFNLHRGLR